MPRNEEGLDYNEDADILQGLEKAARGEIGDSPRKPRRTIGSIKRSAGDFIRAAGDASFDSGMGSIDFDSDVKRGARITIAGAVAPGTIVKNDRGEDVGVVTRDDGSGKAKVKDNTGKEIEMDSAAIEETMKNSGYSLGDEIYVGEPEESENWPKAFIGTVVGSKTVTGAKVILVEAASGVIYDVLEERIGKKASVTRVAKVKKTAQEPRLQKGNDTAPQQSMNVGEDGDVTGQDNMGQEEDEQPINLDNREPAPEARPGEYGGMYEKYLKDMLTNPDVAVTIVEKMIEDGKAKPEMIVRLNSILPADGNFATKEWLAKNGMLLLDEFVKLHGVNNINKLSGIFKKPGIGTPKGGSMKAKVAYPDFGDDGTSGQDRESYTDDQDRDSYTVSTDDDDVGNLERYVDEAEAYYQRMGLAPSQADIVNYVKDAWSDESGSDMSYDDVHRMLSEAGLLVGEIM